MGFWQQKRKFNQCFQMFTFNFKSNTSYFKVFSEATLWILLALVVLESTQTQLTIRITNF